MVNNNQSEAQTVEPGLLLSTWNNLLDLVFPPRCAGCDRVGEAWCLRCQRELDAVPVQLLRRRLNTNQVAIAATGRHEGKLQQAIQAMKYENLPELRHPLGGRIIALLKRHRLPFDLVVPVPLHTSRHKQRGYNQAALLAQAVARDLRIDYQPGAALRIRATPPQVGLNRQQRLNNMHGAFHAESSIVAGRRVLVVDDVCTTGATLAACAQAIRDAGAQQIYGFTISIAT